MRVFYELSGYPARRHTDIVSDLNTFADNLRKEGNMLEFNVKPSKRYPNYGVIIVKSNLEKNIILEAIGDALRNNVASRLWW